MAGRISFIIDVDDKASMETVAIALLGMVRGVSAAGVLAASTRPTGEAECCAGKQCEPIMPPQPSATTPHGDFTREQVNAAEALAAAGTECPGVNVAAALATVPVPPMPEAGSPMDVPIYSPPAPFTPPAASVAPPAPVAAPSAPTPAAAVELDKNNLPWDARINTSNKAKTEKGVWKMKKGMPEGYYDQVVAELKGVMAAPAPTPTPAAPAAPQPPVPAAPTASAAPTTMVPPPPSASPVVAASPGVQTVPPSGTPDEAEPTTYPQLLQAVSKRTMTSKITADEVNNVCQVHGIPSINLVANRPDLFSVIYQGCAAIWNAR